MSRFLLNLRSAERSNSTDSHSLPGIASIPRDVSDPRFRIPALDIVGNMGESLDYTQGNNDNTVEDSMYRRTQALEDSTRENPEAGGFLHSLVRAHGMP